MVTNIITPLAFDITTANIYDSQLSTLIYKFKVHNLFVILADATYDDKIWFTVAKNLDLNLLTDINMRNSKSIESFNKNRYNNELFRKSPIMSKAYKIEQLFRY